MKIRYIVSLLVLATLSGCGLSETAATTAALAEAQAQNAKAAQETQAKIEQKLQAAQDAQNEQRKAMEAATE